MTEVELLRKAVQETGDAYLRTAFGLRALPSDVILEANFDDGIAVLRVRDKGSGEDLTGPMVVEA